MECTQRKSVRRDRINGSSSGARSVVFDQRVKKEMNLDLEKKKRADD
jgi:hypothetical protein